LTHFEKYAVHFFMFCGAALSFSMVVVFINDVLTNHYQRQWGEFALVGIFVCLIILFITVSNLVGY